MKILVISHSSELSGANKSMISIIKELNPLVEFTILTNGPSEILQKELKNTNIEVLSCKYGWWYATPRKNIYKSLMRYVIDAGKYYSCRKINKDLLKILLKANFDVVYTNTSTIDIGIKIAKFLNVPHVWHIREFGQEDFGFRSIVSTRYRERCISDSDAVITISDALRKKYSTFIDIQKLYLVYNGFDIDNLYCTPRTHNLSKEVNILISGQVCEAKGQHQAVAAVARLNEIGYCATLFVAGDIDHSYFDKVLDKYGNPTWVKLLNRVENMYELRNKMDIELVCSKSEAFGRVTLEAMLHGIPVIGSATGATTELIKDGVTGLLYESQNISELVNQLCRLIDNKDIYESIVKNASEYAKNFTISKTANEIYQIFVKLIANDRELDSI